MKPQEETWIEEVGLVGAADYYFLARVNILAKTIGWRLANKHT